MFPALAAGFSSEGYDQHSDWSRVDPQRILEQDEDLLRSSWSGRPVHSHHRRTAVSPDRTRSLSLENEPAANFLSPQLCPGRPDIRRGEDCRSQGSLQRDPSGRGRAVFYGNKSHVEEETLRRGPAGLRRLFAEYAPSETKET